MRAGAAAGVIVLVGTVALTGALAPAGRADAPQAAPCDGLQVGGPLGAAIPWAQTRLNFQRAWPVTRGKGIRVAVIDSGLDLRNPQLHGMHVDQGRNVFPGFGPNDVRDCSGTGHGTSVTATIAAQQQTSVSFVGVAPDVTIIPIKQSNTANSGNAAGISAAIDQAIAAKAQVVNISVTAPNPGDTLRSAVARAANANLVIVAAAGNDGQGQNLPAYPAAYSTEFANVIAVSASNAQDGIGPFSDTGNYVDVAAPGVDVDLLAPVSGYRIKQSGTSFAAPYVTGTVALVLASHPGIRADEVRNRIEATADRPPTTVPNRTYGYGIVNPYLAVTTIRDDSLTAAPAGPTAPLPAVAAPPHADRHLAHVALGTTIVLLGLAVLASAGAAVLRGRKRSTQETSSSRIAAPL